MTDLTPLGKESPLTPLPKPRKTREVQTQEPLTLWKQIMITELETDPLIAPYISAGWKLQIVPQRTYTRLQQPTKTARYFAVISSYSVRHDGRSHQYTALLCQPGFNPGKGQKGASNPLSGRKVRLAPNHRTVFNKSYKLNQVLKQALLAKLPDFTVSNAECNNLIRQGIAALSTDPEQWNVIDLPTVQPDWGEAENQTFSIRFNQEQWQQVDGLRRSDQDEKESTSKLLRRLLYVGVLVAASRL
jgi:hypothetical protein